MPTVGSRLDRSSGACVPCIRRSILASRAFVPAVIVRRIIVPPIILTVNRKQVKVAVSDETMPLLWVLRDHLGLTGTKYGCGIGQCGACTVHQDGVAIKSCLTPVQSVV